ncbi:hypothetical protein NDU88_004164 [Pleurodeles waltl]|uniref:Uncharacterized protein n=1 Tax=Pleurodeles waltl TaxID=8319 RepID=A0AAV7KZJ3_PLEWA|nr:hypothetical protein NDU88_004164 [Pleurodeles waltl]
MTNSTTRRWATEDYVAVSVFVSPQLIARHQEIALRRRDVARQLPSSPRTRIRETTTISVKCQLRNAQDLYTTP